MTDADLLAGQLEVWLGRPVRDLRRLTGGASRETWAFRAADRALILQRDRPGAVRTGGGMPAEAALLPLAREAGVPVPELIEADVSGEHTGSPAMVTAHVDGETIARRIQRDDRFAEARRRFAHDAAVALAGIHAVDHHAVPGLVGGDQVTQFREIFDAFGEAHPAFELAFRWLELNRPPSDRAGLVHGDFRLGNLMIDDQGLAVVLDWELAHVGDPMEDLGWLCVRAWRFGGVEPVGGLGTREALFAAYEEASGSVVDADVVRWWEVLGTLKWGVMCMIQASSHLLGHARSVELAAIGRRVCENEHDLMELLR